jgi:histidinol-phosphate aminotransferase
MRLVINPGDVLLDCPPTFGMYAFDGNVNQAKVINVPREPDFCLDLIAVKEAVEKYSPKLLFLAHPNNPDGKLIPRHQIQALLDLPILLVLDEAYINFSTPSESWINQVENYRNLIILRSFSKWAGLAGLRIGYGVFPKSLVPILMKAKQPYNVSVVAEQAAYISMVNVEKVENITRLIRNERENLFDQLSNIPWLEPYPSQANFILNKVVGVDALSVKNRLRGKGILIRHFEKLGLKDHIRISVGKPEQTDILINALREME